MENDAGYLDFAYFCTHENVRVVELVDTPLWGGGGRKAVQVQVLSRTLHQAAPMAELVDALHSGCSGRTPVQVRLLFGAPIGKKFIFLPIFGWVIWQIFN